jgi:hypothetical protein
MTALPTWVNESVVDAVKQAILDENMRPTNGDGESQYAAEAAIGVLHRLGLLAEPPGVEPEEEPVNVEDVARWLAAQSDHPRYTATEDGWTALLDSPGNVTHAHAAALPRTAHADMPSLNAARDVLLDNARRRVCAEVAG